MKEKVEIINFNGIHFLVVEDEKVIINLNNLKRVKLTYINSAEALEFYDGKEITIVKSLTFADFVKLLKANMTSSINSAVGFMSALLENQTEES